MRDSLLVRTVEPVGDLDPVAQRLIERHRPPRQPVRERFAFEVLHDEELGVAVAPDVVERADVRMREAPRSSCASRSNRWRSSGTVARWRRQHLDRDVRSSRVSRAR